MTPEKFKAWREKIGWSQVEAAELLGMSRNTLRAYESGQAKIPRYIALATWTLHEMADDPECWDAFFEEEAEGNAGQRAG